MCASDRRRRAAQQPQQGDNQAGAHGKREDQVLASQLKLLLPQSTWGLRDFSVPLGGLPGLCGELTVPVSSEFVSIRRQWVTPGNRVWVWIGVQFKWWMRIACTPFGQSSNPEQSTLLEIGCT